VVLNGGDGKVVVDTFVLPAWPKFKEALDGLGKGPMKFVIDTHWHFDHTDNNALLHAAGAMVLAHENTKKRMSEPHELVVLGLNFRLHLPLPSRRKPSRAPTSSRPMARLWRWRTFRPRTPTRTSSSIIRRPTFCMPAISFSTAFIPSSTPAPAAASAA
jgi:metallo-beta-lactamase superfamily protein